MASDKWRVIVDWNIRAMADRELDVWLRHHSVTRHDMAGDDIRRDVSRSVRRRAEVPLLDP